MTRKEWIEKNLPAWINENADGGVIGCPNWYRELARIDPSVLTNKTCIKRPRDESFNVCKECWNMELNVQEERSNNMTRKEWMLKNHPDVVFPMVRGGVVGCPGTYLDLADIDPSVAECSSTRCGTDPDCTACWNQEIPGTKKTRPHGFRLEKMEKAVKEADLSIKEAIDRGTCDCDTCTHRDICRFECQFRGMTKEMYRHCIEETARYNIPELGIQMRPLHCKRYEPTPTIEKLNTAVFQLKAQNLTDEMVRKIFDEEPKESK